MTELRSAFSDPKVIDSFELRAIGKGNSDFESVHSKKFAALAFDAPHNIKLKNAFIDELYFNGNSLNLEKCSIGGLK